MVIGAVLPVLLVAGYVVARRLDTGGEARDPSVPPPGADDPSNPGILIAAGGVIGQDYDPDPWNEEEPAERSGGGTPYRVSSFWMQQHEVTNEEFARWDAQHRFPEDRARYPVTRVTWERAMGYAIWLGGRLPTEAEWEMAAAGPEARLFPWGEADPTCDLTHFQPCEPRGAIPVMSRPAGATPQGIHDLAGNVWEWVTPNWFTLGRTPINNAARRLRGGSYDDERYYLRTSNRNNDFFAGFQLPSIGFRVVWPVEGG